jgi:hypothetical protein
MSIRQFVLPFKIDFQPSATKATAHAGLPLLLEALRAVIPRSAYKRLAKALGLKRWRTARRHLESLVLLVAAGGEHLCDLEYLRADEGLRRLLGFELSSPTQAKEFLYAFHQAEDGRRLTADDDEELSVKGEARTQIVGRFRRSRSRSRSRSRRHGRRSTVHGFTCAGSGSQAVSGPAEKPDDQGPCFSRCQRSRCSPFQVMFDTTAKCCQRWPSSCSRSRCRERTRIATSRKATPSFL